MITSADEKRVLDLVPTKLYLNGQWVDAEGGKTLDVFDPATGKKLLAIADASYADGQKAIEAAHNAQESWAKTAPRVRAEILRAAFEKVTAMSDDFATLMSLEMGKPFAEAKGEVARKAGADDVVIYPRGEMDKDASKALSQASMPTRTPRLRMSRKASSKSMSTAGPKC